MTKRVWILEPIGYDEHGIIGVFATLDAAKAHYDCEWGDDGDGEWTTVDADACSNTGYFIYADEIRGLDDES